MPTLDEFRNKLKELDELTSLKDKMIDELNSQISEYNLSWGLAPLLSPVLLLASFRVLRPATVCLPSLPQKRMSSRMKAFSH